ncbi:helix-turn-helix domain-containing protein [Catenulispora sp. NF23]|uniref:GlxA family transcriptional regulator n=1 Tax=Catenulispora pinistramenti TaxID=2705254 RepID=UPI001BA6A54F|nr:helix-turn-helix domain-containing protein [Catenulispora pinistramenti]MBS2536642.1 helix-turn-helix domain-containing protein [Catenulispora pinistramenti]
MGKHIVAVAVTEGAPIFEISIPVEVFGRVRPGMADLGYQVQICNPESGPVFAGGGFVAPGGHTYAALAKADTVILSAISDVREELSAELIAAVRQAHANGARVASLCSGAFILAAAGLLDGRRATTHWLYAEEFRKRFPAVLLDPAVLYIDHGDVLTSAGTTAGIDLCLAMVAADHGADVANTLARRLVAPTHRSGGQAQYVETPAPPAAGRDGLGPLLDWMRTHLDEPLTVAALARQANVAERTLIRRFHTAVGTTPGKWLTAQRVLHARCLLETTDLPVERVASAAGLGGAANLRHHFTEVVGVAPSDYRRSFRGVAAASSAHGE